jgi:RHH-type proline utilization regulon transcriptional repressor/proline dehydrogenase/delta 1-pyrroline-5-carboxylate dehydrogenase
LHDLAQRLDRKIMVRLVKGAYWDGEVKRAQVLGLASFPVLTRKEAADVSYLANARRLLSRAGRLYPQFATHNAHTVAGVLHLAREMKVPPQEFEFQRLHGMGEALHELILADHGTRCRIYAPVGAHRDLLAYLVRRLLENGANSSFVNQIVNTEIPPETVAACPLTRLESLADLANPVLTVGPGLFPGRINSRGFDLTDMGDLALIEQARAPMRHSLFHAAPILAGPVAGKARETCRSPSDDSALGEVVWASSADVETSLSAARAWDAVPEVRAKVLARAADLYEAETGAIFALLAREAGKTPGDAVSELREAVDFLRYYATGAAQPHPARGTFACISPWNFPLAIFTGQIAAALAAGNAVIAKPAEQTPLIAHLAVTLLHRAGVPASALQLLPGDGALGAALTADARIAGVAFTGSTETARAIRSAMARHLAPGVPLIAETGGLNAMVVDSTALPEQAVRDILASAFQSAGQRCSALRCLYVQEEIAEPLLAMLRGAMDGLTLGDPWALATDIGPLIDKDARESIFAYVAAARAEGRVLHALAAPRTGAFLGPVLIRVRGIADLPGEVFGPVLHVATFRAAGLPQVLAAINASGFGLTFGLHSRIDDRVEAVAKTIRAGNLYVNRNQIGAVVGSQPFGGEGLSGTGPKAGGPHYLSRFTAAPVPSRHGAERPPAAGEAEVVRALVAARPAAEPMTETLPGPTGESNRLVLVPRAPLLCLGPGQEDVVAQMAAVRHLGGACVAAPGLAPDSLARLQGVSGAIFWGDDLNARAYALALAGRDGPILPLITEMPDLAHVVQERVICIDTTASGGNAQLLAEVSAPG